MGSQLKKAHKTHALAQRAGEPYPHADASSSSRGAGDEGVSARFAQLCERVPDPVERAALLGVSVATDEAWTRGSALPVLRAHRKALERALHATG